MTKSKVSSPSSHSASRTQAEGAAATTPGSPASTLSLPTPPPLTSVPVVPKGFVAPASTARGAVPRSSEQVVLEAAITDVSKLPNYDSLVGAPPRAELVQLLTLAMQWTAIRNASSEWDEFAKAQEAVVWTQARAGLEKFKAPFALLVATNGSIATQNPALVTLLGARSAIAQKGASTRKANKKNEAAGKAPTHGAVGKKRERSAEKAALVEEEQQQTGASNGAPPNGTNGAAQANGAPSANGAARS